MSYLTMHSTHFIYGYMVEEMSKKNIYMYVYYTICPCTCGWLVTIKVDACKTSLAEESYLCQ